MKDTSQIKPLDCGSGKFIGNIFISGSIKLVTGMHIGVGGSTTEIGSTDGLIIRDPISMRPYIPGSTIKGKMRSLMEKLLFAELKAKNKSISIEKFFPNINNKDNYKIRIHRCANENCPICRLFGAVGVNGYTNQNRVGRLSVLDAQINEDYFNNVLRNLETERYLTEVKWENAIDRITSDAQPRSFERVPKGTEFDFALTYTMDDNINSDMTQSDLKYLIGGLAALADSWLGGHGSRGYGRIRIISETLKIEYRPYNYYFGDNSPVVIKASKLFEENDGEILADTKAVLKKLLVNLKKNLR